VAARDEAVRARRERVLRLKALGLSYAQIAAQEAADTGQPRRKEAAIRVDLQRAVADAELTGEAADTDTQVAVELVRLEGLERAMQTVLRAATAQPCQHCGSVPDPKTAMAASAELRALGAERRRLRALDAPPQRHGAAPPADPAMTQIRRSANRKLGVVG
jgi:hypothetical protein